MATAPPVSEIERLQDDNRVLIERLTGLENELARKDKIIHENTEQKDKLSLDVKENKKEVDQLQARLQEFEDENKALMERHSDLKKELDSTINENARLNTKKDELSEQVYQLQNQLEQAEEEAFNAKSKLTINSLNCIVNFISRGSSSGYILLYNNTAAKFMPLHLSFVVCTN